MANNSHQQSIADSAYLLRKSLESFNQVSWLPVLLEWAKLFSELDELIEDPYRDTALIQIDYCVQAIAKSSPSTNLHSDSGLAFAIANLEFHTWHLSRQTPTDYRWDPTVDSLQNFLQPKNVLWQLDLDQSQLEKIAGKLLQLKLNRNAS